jgi:RNA polymerase-interacting CarD/CdnL/TRCF family regulator
MQFNTGDIIVHPVYGVGNILKIEEKRFSEIEKCLYYKISLSRSEIWVPVEAQEDIGLRLVTTNEDLGQYRDILKSRTVLIDDNFFGKDADLSGRLKDGSFQTVCEIVRDLTVLGWQKPLGVSAKTILRKAQEKLYEEWSIAAGISVAEANTEIASLLMKETPEDAPLK